MFASVRVLLVVVTVVVIFLFVRAGCRHENVVVISVPPANSGSLKIGVWVLNLKRYCRKNNGPTGVASLLLKHGISYVIPKTHSAYFRGKLIDGWYPDCPELLFQQFVTACHTKGIKVYAWAYIYGGIAAQTDLKLSSVALASDADGLVLNAESEYCRDAKRYSDANNLCVAIRQFRDTKYPGKLLAYSTFARSWKGIGQHFPYRVFGQYCDQFWPQTYWRTFKCSPESAVNSVDLRLRAKYTKWQTQPKWVIGIKPIIHTGHVYAKSIPSAEVQRFLTAAINQGHKEVNLYTADYFSSNQWRVIDKFTLTNLVERQTSKSRGFFGWIETFFQIYIIIAIIHGIGHLFISNRPWFERISDALAVAFWWPLDLWKKIQLDS